MFEGLAGDSFFTLTLLERIGLVTLSLAMLLSFAAVSCMIFRRFGGIVGVFVVGLLYWAFLWGAPQIYYLYYLAIFDGLPWQWVLGDPPALGKLVMFQERATLSAISQGAGFWVVLGVGLGCAAHKSRIRE